MSGRGLCAASVSDLLIGGFVNHVPDQAEVRHDRLDFQVHPAEACAGLEKSGHADSTWSCVQGLQYREVSMSTSLLYHAFGIRGYEYTRTRYEGGAVIFSIRQGRETCRCSSCGSTRVVHRGQVAR